MKINEIFYSIQGEGKWTGIPNIFIRTTGCNLRCNYCDTKYAYVEGVEKNILEITNEIKKYPCNKICITGGEPLIQDDINKLIEELIVQKYEIIIETNGSIKVDKLASIKDVIISMDVKCPSSMMDDKMILQNISFLKTKDQMKFIINDKKDYSYAKKIMEKYKPKCELFFQPVWGKDPKILAEWIKNDDLPAKLGLQIHKIIWGGTTGV